MNEVFKEQLQQKQNLLWFEQPIKALQNSFYCIKHVLKGYFKDFKLSLHLRFHS